MTIRGRSLLVNRGDAIAPQELSFFEPLSSHQRFRLNHIGPKLHDDRPRIVAFGSGKGGTGKSTLCADIARALTRYNFRVLCIDNAWGCPSLNILLRCEEPTFDIAGEQGTGLGDPDSHIAEFIVPTGYPSVFLASLAAARRHPFSPPSFHADELLHQLYELDFDWILIDMSDGLSALDVGMFTLSDIPILITTPEPAAVRQTTQFLRAVLFRAIGYHPDAASLETEVLDILYNQPLDFRAQDLRYDAPSANSRAIIDETLQRLEPYMIVNLVREGAEHDLGFVLSHALHHELQIFPRVLTSIEYADRRWFYNRRNTGLNSSRSEEGLSNDIELLARNIRDISLVDLRYPRPIPTRGEMHPALRMGLNPELSRNEVRQYCRRLWEGYRRENAISLVFGDPDQREEIAARLETLYRQVLTMPSESFSKTEVEQASRQYNAQERSPRPSPSNFKRPSESAKKDNRNGSPSGAKDPSDTQDSDNSESTKQTRNSTLREDSEGRPKARLDRRDQESGDETSSVSLSSPGETLAELRREASMSLQELSSRTHIGVKYLAAIEEVDIEVLPRRVYLRGYIREIARVFGVDGRKLLQDYFEYLERG